MNNNVREELAKLQPSSIIELFTLQTSERLHGSAQVYRFHAGVNAKSVTGPVIWAGEAYAPWPIEAEGFEWSGNSTLPRPKVRIANVEGTITTVLQQVNQINFGSDLMAAQVTRIRTMARFLDAVNFEGDVNPFGTPDPTASLPNEQFYIDRKSAETRELVEFELVAAFDLAGVRIPKRQTISNICQFIYKGVECGYDGSKYFDVNDNPVSSATQDVCGKRLKSCQLRFGESSELPFGSYPGVGQYNF